MREFKKLSDSEWVNVVNHPDVLGCGGGHAAEDAVAKAFNLIESRFIEKNQPILDELAEQRAELLAALKFARDELVSLYNEAGEYEFVNYALIDDAIDKAEARS